MYTRGSNAYQLPNIQPEPQKPQRQAPKKAFRPRAGQVIAVIFVLALAFVVLLRDGQIAQMNKEVKAKSNTLGTAQAKIEQSRLELAQNINLSKIAEDATKRLGMVKAQKHQYVYMTVKQNDSVVVSKENKENKTTIFQNLGELFSFFK